MHKSRLGGFIIDCNSDDLDAAARFWSAALDSRRSRRLRQGRAIPDSRFAADQPHLEVQRVAHPSRVHLDIEADDIEAEVAGSRARRPAHRPGCNLVCDAGAHRPALLRVRAQRADFDAKANTWND